MRARTVIEPRTIPIREIEAGIHRARTLRARHLAGLVARAVAALRPAPAHRGAPCGEPLTHGC